MDPITAQFFALFAKVPWLLPGCIAFVFLAPIVVRAGRWEQTAIGHFVLSLTSDLRGVFAGRPPEVIAARMAEKAAAMLPTPGPIAITEAAPVMVETATQRQATVPDGERP